MNVGKKMLPKQKEKKIKIFEAAREIFAEKGYENTTMSQIAFASNVAIGTIYEYFDNKEELFFYVAAERYETFDKELKIQLSGIKSAFDKIRKYIWFYFYYFQKDPVYAELWLFNIRLNKRLSASNEHPWMQQSGRVIIDMLREGQAEGVVRQDVSLYVIRHMILGSLEHAMTRWLLKGKVYDVLPYSENISDLIIEAIKKRS